MTERMKLRLATAAIALVDAAIVVALALKWASENEIVVWR